MASSGIETVVKYWSPFPLNLQNEPNKSHLSSTYNNRRISPYLMTHPLTLDVNSDDGLVSSTNNDSTENEICLNYFDNLIRHDLSRDELEEEFTSISRSANRMQINDTNFKHNLKFIESLIQDFKENGEKNKTSLIKRLKKEEKKDNSKPSKVMTTRSISYLFQCKKLKQSKFLLKSCFKLVQDRIRYLRKVKHMNNNRDDEDLIQFISIEPKLKEILNDLNAMYKDIRLIENISSPVNAYLLKLLDCLFFRRTLTNFAPSTTFMHDDSSDTSTDEELENNQSPTNSNHKNEISNNAKQKKKEDNSSSSTESESSRDLRLSDDDSLSADSLIVSNDDDSEKKEKSKKSLKRKRSILKKSDFVIDLHLFSSDESDSSEDRLIRKMKKSKEKFKATDYNFYAFDSDIDCSELSSDENTDSSEQIHFTKLRKKNERIKCINLANTTSFNSKFSNTGESSETNDRNNNDLSSSNEED